jgi:hypothetical protein
MRNRPEPRTFRAVPSHFIGTKNLGGLKAQRLGLFTAASTSVLIWTPACPDSVAMADEALRQIG